MNISLLRKVPDDIIISNIIPYTYEKKPIRHMADIRNFYESYRTIADYYYTELNEYILLRDIVHFYNCGHSLNEGIEHLFTVKLNRNISLQKYSLEEKYVFIFLNYKDNVLIDMNKKITFLWGLMKPIERAYFINKNIPQ
jgi:hypothetical protein